MSYDVKHYCLTPYLLFLYEEYVFKRSIVISENFITYDFT